MGIIDSLSAGFRFLGRRVELLLIPVFLDLLLWLAPRLSVAPLFERAGAAYAALSDLALNTAGDLPAEITDITQSTQEMMRLLGESSNLWTALVSGSILHVPSLLATAALPPSRGGALALDSLLLAAALWVLLALAGLLVGVVFLEMLARVLPLGATHKPSGGSELLRAIVRHWLRVLGFVLIVGVALVVLLVPLSLLLGLMTLLSPLFASFGVALLGGILLMVYVYLYFVTAAIVLDDMPVLEAIATSIRLVRVHFFRVLGFALLVAVITAGIGLLLDRLSAFQPIGTVAAILLNSYIGTGLSMALLVFYRSRLLLSAQVAEQHV